jgi:hypothetical protein
MCMCSPRPDPLKTNLPLDRLMLREHTLELVDRLDMRGARQLCHEADFGVG